MFTRFIGIGGNGFHVQQPESEERKEMVAKKFIYIGTKHESKMNEKNVTFGSIFKSKQHIFMFFFSSSLFLSFGKLLSGDVRMCQSVRQIEVKRRM